MLAELMNLGGYRVDYFNRSAFQSERPFGFYVCGEKLRGAAYSVCAKHHLYLGLDLIQRELGWKNLVGIYVDVSCSSGFPRPAFEQLQADVRSGMFHRIFAVSCRDLIKDEAVRRGLIALDGAAGSLELIGCDLENEKLSAVSVYSLADLLSPEMAG